MSVLKKAIAKVRSPSASPATSPKKERRDLPPSPDRSPTARQNSPLSPLSPKHTDSDLSATSRIHRVSSLINHVRSKSLSVRKTSAPTELAASGATVQRNATLPSKKGGANGSAQTAPEGPREVIGSQDLERKLSMTEMKDERKTEREAKDDEEQERRRKRHEEAWNNVRPLCAARGAD